MKLNGNILEVTIASPMGGTMQVFIDIHEIAAVASSPDEQRTPIMLKGGVSMDAVGDLANEIIFAMTHLHRNPVDNIIDVPEAYKRHNEVKEAVR